MADYKNIAVKHETFERFKEYGKFGESSDEVLGRILDVADEALKFAKVVERIRRENGPRNTAQ